MNTLDLIVLAIGLAMDAFSVSICKGLSLPHSNRAYPWVIALFFGTFQAIMPLIGFFLGKQFEQYIQAFDHWVAFVLLVFLGAKMLYECFRHSKEELAPSAINYKELFLLAIATSIDALAVGITFAFLKTDVAIAVLSIGIITFVLCLIGVWIGKKFGSRWQKPAEILGGIILILIGCKILFNHLGILPF